MSTTKENRMEQREQAVEAPSGDPSCAKALACARAAIDKKAEHVKVLNLTGISGFTDYFVICSGMSDRQVQAIADSVEFQVESAGSRSSFGRRLRRRPLGADGLWRCRRPCFSRFTPGILRSRGALGGRPAREDSV